MTTTTYTAWATTAVSMPESSPGIAITTSTTDADGYREEQGLDECTDDLPETWGQAGDDGADLDWYAANTELHALGYRRTGDWYADPNGWGATVTPIKEGQS